ncbi:YolD-like family protein, partial [Siminovitchia fortis]
MRPNKLTPNENLRWQSSRMMLPEHVERLQELDVEREK